MTDCRARIVRVQNGGGGGREKTEEKEQTDETSSHDSAPIHRYGIGWFSHALLSWIAA